MTVIDIISPQVKIAIFFLFLLPESSFAGQRVFVGSTGNVPLELTNFDLFVSVGVLVDLDFESVLFECLFDTLRWLGIDGE